MWQFGSRHSRLLSAGAVGENHQKRMLNVSCPEQYGATSALAAWVAAVVLAMTCAAFAQKVGEFKGELILRALPDGRTMELTAPFSYVDRHGVAWSVPSGTRVDGASIPSVFWSIIGAPYTGRYREASVIHDYFCATKSRHWKAVHKVFLDGMLARGSTRPRRS